MTFFAFKPIFLHNSAYRQDFCELPEYQNKDMRIVLFFLLVAFLASCSGLKPLNSSIVSASARTSNETTSATKKDSKVTFLEDISVSASNPSAKPTGLVVDTRTTKKASVTSPAFTAAPVAVSMLQQKYAGLLNVDAQLLTEPGTVGLLEQIEEWYGTRYKYGGTGKNGIDCSAFTQTIYSSVFGMSIPRTASEQFRSAKIISTTELQQGDLVFFNTTGGISHVGIYLTNNKFVHASSTGGVKISDLFEAYYLRRYLGAGRLDKPQASLN